MQTENLEADATRKNDYIVPLLTVNFKQLAELQFTVKNVPSLVNYFRNGNKMFFRVIGS